MTQRQLSVSDMGNPAQAFPGAEGETRHGIGAAVGLGIEYQGNDNFYRLLDALGRDDALAPGDGGGDGGGGSGGGTGPGDDTGRPGGDIDIDNPELEALIARIKQEAIVLGSLIAVAATDLNAKVFTSANLPVLISSDALGGAWSFSANYSIITNLRGVREPIEFDAQKALETLQTALQDRPTEITTYELGGGASITVDPATGETRFRFSNDSATLFKAAQVTEIAVAYSRSIWSREEKAVHIGLRPKYLDVGLSNTTVPIADLKNAKSIFDALDKQSFSYSRQISLDLGLTWTTKRYQLGATLTNLNQPEFHYPPSDLSSFSNPRIINTIRDLETYTMERQLKLEGGMVTPGGAWGLSLGLDANPVPDPMGNDYQWLSVSAGFASANWWLPGARLGVRKNLAGSELTYLTAGLTLFNNVNLDLASTAETINIDGTTLPRGFIGNLSVQFVF